MTTPDPRIVGVLAEHAALTRAVVERFLRAQDDDAYLGPLIAEYPRRDGQMLAASICLVAVRTFGGRLERALGTAAALQLMHYALSVHHDVADDRTHRLGAATLHRQHDVPLAINAGDTLMVLSLRPLHDSRHGFGPGLSVRMLRELKQAAQHGLQGWMTELAWRRDGILEPGEEAYLRMASGRTAWPVAIGPLRMGALTAGGRGSALDRLIRCGLLLGVALQIHEEIAPLVESSSTPLADCSHLLASRRTLPLIYLADRIGGDSRDRLVAIMDSPRERLEPGDWAWVRDQLQSEGCLESARAMALALADAALVEAQETVRDVSTTERHLLPELACWVSDTIRMECPSDGLP